MQFGHSKRKRVARKWPLKGHLKGSDSHQFVSNHAPAQVSTEGANVSTA